MLIVQPGSFRTKAVCCNTFYAPDGPLGHVMVADYNLKWEFKRSPLTSEWCRI
jgi:hypothetical protein